jgi:hypothetical protein
MSEELNPQGSSQPIADTSVGAGPNAAGKPSEPVAQSTMTPSQSSDYYNKTQQLAQERREFEAERQSWEQQRSQQHGTPQNYGQNQGYDGQYPAPQPQSFTPQLDPQTYAALVQEFGVEGANAQARAIQQSTAPVQQQLKAALEQARRAEIMSITQSLNLKGQSLFGAEEWKAKGEAVMQKVTRYGIPLEEAWYATNGADIERAAMDRAYQSQNTKQGANAQQTNIQPAATQSGDVGNMEDAFEQAWGQFSG